MCAASVYDLCLSNALHKGRYVFNCGGGGGGPGLRRGGSSRNFFQIVEGQTRFIRDWGRVTVFLARKK